MDNAGTPFPGRLFSLGPYGTWSVQQSWTDELYKGGLNGSAKAGVANQILKSTTTGELGHLSLPFGSQWLLEGTVPPSGVSWASVFVAGWHACGRCTWAHEVAREMGD